MKHLKDWVTTLLKMLGAAVVIALVVLLIEVIAGVFLFELDSLFG